jgi:hypothetical protein
VDPLNYNLPVLNLEAGGCVVSVSRPCLLGATGRCGSSCCSQGSGDLVHMNKRDSCTMGSWETYR